MHKVTSRSSLGSDKSQRSDNGKPQDSSVVNVGGTSMDVEEWRRAISTPTKYRVGSASFHLRPRDILQLVVVFLVILVITFLVYNGGSNKAYHVSRDDNLSYNSIYPFSTAIAVEGGKKLRIAVITDLDHGSKTETPNKWKSYFLKGYLFVFNNGSFAVVWDDEPVTLYSSLANGGRGMELSELVVFNGRLLTVDDRTGVVYKIIDDHVVPWLILADGNGEVPKGFKSEWAAVKDRQLYMGGLGKEWTSGTGEVLNLDPQFVKRISPTGSIEHLDWHTNYNKMKEKAGFYAPGYMIHESGTWSDVHQKWFFLPRRASKERYDEKLDEKRAANILVTADADFAHIETRKFGPSSSTHGFSSFKFIPGSSDQQIVALKSEEDGDHIASYIMVFDLNGRMRTSEMLIGNHKYEGIEFI